MPKAKMSKSNVENGIEKVEVNKVFTDRISARDAFWKSYDEINSDLENYKVLSYYGLGGIGKTTLIEKLISEVKEKDGSFINFNFEYYSSIDKVLVLRDLGSKLFKLDKDRFKFYRFRIALSRYAEETEQELEIKNENSSFLSKNAIADLCLDLTESIPDILEKAPFLGKLVTGIRLADKTRQVIKNQIDINAMKSTLEDIKSKEIKELVDKMHEYFAEDLAESMLSINKPLVIFVDTYEKFTDALVEDFGKFNEAWLKKIVSTAQGILWVFSGREALDWEESFEVENIELNYLSLDDSKSFLVNAGVNEALVEGIYNLTEGNPVFLDICVDRYYELLEENKTPTIEDFGETKEKLLERYAKYMKSNIKSIAHFLSYIENWDDEELLDLKKRSNLLSFNYEDYEILKSHSFIKEDGNKFFMNRTVKDVFYDDISQEMKKEYNKILLDYYMENALDNKKSLESIEYASLATKELTRIKTVIDEDWIARFVELNQILIELSNSGKIQDVLLLRKNIEDYFDKDKDNLSPFEIGAYYKNLLLIADDLNVIDNKSEAINIYESVYNTYIENGVNNMEAFNILEKIAGIYEYNDEFIKARDIYKELYLKYNELYGRCDEDTIRMMKAFANACKRAGHEDNYKTVMNYIAQREEEAKTAPKRTGEEDLALKYGYTKEFMDKAFEISDHLNENVLNKMHIKTSEELDKDSEEIEIIKKLSDEVDICLDKEDYQKALELQKNVTEISIRVFGENNLSTIAQKAALAKLYMNIDDYKSAIELFEKIKSNMIDLFGEKSSTYLEFLFEYGRCYYFLEEYEKAIEILTKAYDLYKKLSLEHTKEAIDVYNLLGNIYQIQKEYDESVKVFSEIKDDMLNVYGAQSIEYLDYLENFGLSLTLSDDNDKALEIMNECYEKNVEVFGEDDEKTKRALLIIEQIKSMNKDN